MRAVAKRQAAIRRTPKATLGDQKAVGCNGEVGRTVKATPVPVLARAEAVNPLRGPTLLEVLLAFFGCARLQGTRITASSTQNSYSVSPATGNGGSYSFLPVVFI